MDAGGKLGYREKGKSNGESWGPGGGEKFWEDAFPGVFGFRITSATPFRSDLSLLGWLQKRLGFFTLLGGSS